MWHSYNFKIIFHFPNSFWPKMETISKLDEMSITISTIFSWHFPFLFYSITHFIHPSETWQIQLSVCFQSVCHCIFCLFFCPVFCPLECFFFNYLSICLLVRVLFVTDICFSILLLLQEVCEDSLATKHSI